MSMEQRVAVAMNCPGYDSINKGFVAEVPSEKSCDNCSHFVDKKCNINLYDKVLVGRNPW